MPLGHEPKFGVMDYLTECSIEREVLGSEASVTCLNCKDEAELPDCIGEFSAVMLWHIVRLGPRSLGRLTSCRAIIRVGVGIDNVDYIQAGALGIPVVNIPDYGTNDVADHGMALLLSLARRLPTYHDSLRDDIVQAWRPETGGEVRRLTGRTLGIVGLGRIGTALAVRAKAFGLRVLFYDPYLSDGFEKSLQVERVASLEELLPECDYLSLHCPLTAATWHMIDDRALAAARPGLTLINVARGGIVDLDAVYRGLQEGRLAAFGADVLEIEPPDPCHPLIRAHRERAGWLDGRLILTPHSAFYAVESRIEMRRKSAQRMLEAVAGIPLRNCVNTPYLVGPRTSILPTPLPAWHEPPVR